MMILIVVNLPANFEKKIFEYVVQLLFYLVLVQNVLALIRQFSEEERATWASYANEIDGRNGYAEFVGRIIMSFSDSSILNTKKASSQDCDTYLVS